MTFTKNHRTPVQLTAVARAAFRAVMEQYRLAGFLPVRANYTLNFNFDVNQTSLPQAASYRSFNTESDVGTTEGTQSRQGKLPPISRRLHVDEYTELSLMGQTDAIGALFEDYARRIAAQIAARVVLAIGEAVETGKVTLNERGLSATIDYGRKAGHTAVAASGAWSGGASTPLDDLEAARQVYGRTVGVTWISPEIMAALATNADLIKTALRRGTDLPTRISQADVRSVLAEWGYGNVVVNDDRVIDQSGAEKRVISSDKLLFLPSEGGGLLGTGGALGTTDLGVTAESISQDVGISENERPGLFSGAMPSHDPEGYDVLDSAIVLPILSNADATFALDVL
jgi:hypothetical protein